MDGKTRICWQYRLDEKKEINESIEYFYEVHSILIMYRRVQIEFNFIVLTYSEPDEFTL